MAGIPTESPLVLRESLGSSHNRLTSAEDYEEALLPGYPPVGLLDANYKNVYHAEQKGHRLPRRAYPGLNAGACAHHGITRENALLLPAAIALGLLIQRRTSWSAPILASARTTYSPHK